MPPAGRDAIRPWDAAAEMPLAPETIDFARGDHLRGDVSSGRRVFVLKSGKVKTRLTASSGKEVILDILGPGDLFGQLGSVVTSLDPGTPLMAEAATDAIALEEGQALSFGVERFREMMERNPALVANLCYRLDGCRRRLERRLVRIFFKSSTGKVAGLLLELGERFGEPAAADISVPIRLTHQEIGSVIGVKRETVSLALADLECQRLITIQRGFITLHDAVKLAKIP